MYYYSKKVYRQDFDGFTKEVQRVPKKSMTKTAPSNLLTCAVFVCQKHGCGSALI
jgi:hypothetical protein